MRAALVLFFLTVLGPAWAQAPSPWHGLRPAESIGADLELVDQHGRPFRLSASGRPLALVAFGYTHCPDICPDTLGLLQRITAAIPERARPARVFVTLDPQRDTPAVLREFLDWFDAGITGLTGEPQAVEAAAAAFRVGLERAPDGAIAHSAYLYLTDAQGRVLLMYPFGTAAEAVLDDIEALYARAARPR